MRKHPTGLAAAIVVGAALAFAPTAMEGGMGGQLKASVALTNRGPMPLCATDCNGANASWIFVYIENKNHLTNAVTHPSQFRTRGTLQNAYVVSSVDQAIFVDGAHYRDTTFRPPPDPQDFQVYSGHWPATVTCGSTSPPCNTVSDPAVVPGEKTTVTFVGWAHVAGEPNGTYVFRYTVHGTLNGAPLDLTTSSPPIVMTD
jgi:hypothetical protein